MLRILSSNTYIKNANHFGMNDETYRRFLPLLNRPNGIVYLTGPTGSGKTTTLYMVLQTIAERQVNVSTIEDLSSAIWPASTRRRSTTLRA